MQVDGWTVGGLAREGTRNVFAWRSRLTVLALASVLMGTACSLLIAEESHNFVEQLTVLQNQGRNVVVFASPSPTKPSSIGRSSCEGLTRTAGVERAGLLVSGAEVEVYQLGQSVPSIRASTSLFPELAHHEALIGAALPRIRKPTLIRTSSGYLTAARESSQPEGIDSNSSLVVALPPTVGSGSECVAVLNPFMNAASTIPALQGQLRVNGNPVLGQEPFASSGDPLETFVNRISRYFPIVIGLAGALAATLQNQLRASEFATYRISGTSRRSLAIIVAFEQMIVAGLGAIAGVVGLLVLSSYVVSPRGEILYVISGFALWIAGSLLGSLPIILKKASALAKDR